MTWCGQALANTVNLWGLNLWSQGHLSYGWIPSPIPKVLVVRAAPISHPRPKVTFVMKAQFWWRPSCLNKIPWGKELKFRGDRSGKLKINWRNCLLVDMFDMLICNWTGPETGQVENRGLSKRSFLLSWTTFAVFGSFAKLSEQNDRQCVRWRDSTVLLQLGILIY